MSTSSTPKTFSLLDASTGKGKTPVLFPREKSDVWWLRQGERKALALFHAAAKRVPAYKDFLQKNGVKAAAIETSEHFSSIPYTDKNNYIKKYSLDERSWDGTVAHSALLAASSGTTGAPTLWPRGREQEAEAALVHEELFKDLYQIHKHKTLAIIGFPMGIYVSGVATTLPLFLTACKHPNLTIATPGNNKESVLKLIPLVRDSYDQVVLVGHPFFVKDVIETARAERISWGRAKIKSFFCSEGFSEEWRAYLSSHVKGSTPESDFFNTYGSSELLLMGYENPETILIKRTLERNEKMNSTLFEHHQTPSLFQYNPMIRYIEKSENSELLFTANSGIPLVRFNLHDAGKVLGREEVEAACDSKQGEIDKALKKAQWHKWHLPFVALYGRSDHTLVFYAANIYPENIHKALNHKKFLGKITGKFQLEKSVQKNMDQLLNIHIELKKGIISTKKLSFDIQKNVLSTLEVVNMEYLFLRRNLQKDLVPRVVLHKYQDPEHFKPGLKPRYIA